MKFPTLKTCFTTVSLFLIGLSSIGQMSTSTVTSEPSICSSDGKVKVLGDVTYLTVLNGVNIPQLGPFTSSDFPTDTIIFDNLAPGSYTVTQSDPLSSDETSYPITVGGNYEQNWNFTGEVLLGPCVGGTPSVEIGNFQIVDATIAEQRPGYNLRISAKNGSLPIDGSTPPLYNTPLSGSFVVPVPSGLDGNYEIQALDACGVFKSIVLNVPVTEPTPIISATTSTLTCDNPTSELVVSGGDSYLWSTTDVSDTIQVSNAGVYSVTAINSVTGCTGTASITINEDFSTPVPSIVASATELTCSLSSIDLVVSGGDTYLWSTGETTQIITVVDSATYTVTATNSTTGCIGTTEVTIIDLKVPPTLVILDTLCNQQGSFFDLVFTQSPGSILSSSHGLVGTDTIYYIPSDVLVQISVSQGACSDTVLLNHFCPMAYGSIGSVVFEDNDGNGQQDGIDSGIPGIKIYLLSDVGATLDSTITDGLGAYMFDSLSSGNYRILFELPSGGVFTQTDQGADNSDSDANPNTGLSGLISIDTSLPSSNQGRNNLTVFAGMITNPTYDLAVFNSVNNATPAWGDTVTYTIDLVNQGNTTIVDIQVEDLLDNGLGFISYTSSSGTYNEFTGQWGTAIITAGDTATLTISTQVNDRGLIPNSAQITAMGFIDDDSIPNNNLASEDDQDAACISAAFVVCPSQGIMANFEIPVGLGLYQWQFNGIDILGATSNTYFASIPGNYSVLVNGTNYELAGGCSDFIVYEVCNCKPTICTPFVIQKN